MNQNPINPLGDLPPIGASDLFSPYSPVVDVIIPVYRGLQETQNCLESVLAYPQTTMIEVVVINDCSPDEGMDEYLEGLARDHKITVLKSPINVGFVNAVNRGMALHPERDVVLLNSDTEVYGDWLDRLRRCAYGSSQVGTVTPFSNNATICSYPRFAQNNLLPTDWSLQTLDSLFSELNHHQSVEIPTAVGFCMYITRCCLSQTGYFDAENFKRGYGEENDFSMRAMNLGFRNLLCADVFVYHKGSVSFGDETESLCDKAQEKIKELHPHYFTLVSDFCSKDPARIFRRKVDAARLMRSPRKRMLFITHVLGGGTEKHVQELAKIFEFDFELFILRPTGSEEISVEWARDGEEWIIYFRLPHAYSELLNSLKTLGIFYIHFHHIIGINQQILQLPRDLGVSYDFTLHDYYPVCPQYTLTLEDGSYCGEPDAAGCNLCLSKRPAPWGMDILSWRTFFQYILIGAKRVIAPSRDVLERMKSYIPSANYVYLPHPELPISLSRVATAFAGSTLKILTAGRLSLSKGLKLLEACAIDAKIRQLPLYFRVIGFPAQEVRKYPDIPLSFYGPYIDAHLPSLIAIERVDAIFFPALCPETYSYTLSYAMRSGLPIVAPRFGAFTERLAEYW